MPGVLLENFKKLNEYDTDKQFNIFNFPALAGLNKIAATILSVIIFIIGLWMGIVLGLDGTLWD